MIEAVLPGVLTFLAGLATVVGTILVGRSSDRQKRRAEDQAHEIELIGKYKELLESTESRLESRIAAMEAQLKDMQYALESERAARSKAEVERDAAIMHASALRGAWPEGAPPVAIPTILRDFFEM